MCPRAGAPRQEKPPELEARVPQLESSLYSLQLKNQHYSYPQRRGFSNQALQAGRWGEDRMCLFSAWWHLSRPAWREGSAITFSPTRMLENMFVQKRKKRTSVYTHTHAHTHTEYLRAQGSLIDEESSQIQVWEKPNPQNTSAGKGHHSMRP